MPHLLLKCYKGKKTKEELKVVADKLANAAAEAMGTTTKSISVCIEEVEPENWKEVYTKDIYGDKEKLYFEPGYTID